MFYIIDLCSFTVEADSEEEAYKDARKMIEQGEIEIDRVILEQN